MQVNFKDARLQRQVSSEKELTKSHGADLAKQFKIRIHHLESTPNLEELQKMPGTWELLKGERKNQISARLPNGKRLIVTPDEPQFKEDGGLDLSKVTSITVMKIDNYHTKG